MWAPGPRRRCKAARAMLPPLCSGPLLSSSAARAPRDLSAPHRTPVCTRRPGGGRQGGADRPIGRGRARGRREAGGAAAAQCTAPFCSAPSAPAGAGHRPPPAPGAMAERLETGIGRAGRPPQSRSTSGRPGGEGGRRALVQAWRNSGPSGPPWRHRPAPRPRACVGCCAGDTRAAAVLGPCLSRQAWAPAALRSGVEWRQPGRWPAVPSSGGQWIHPTEHTPPFPVSTALGISERGIWMRIFVAAASAATAAVPPALPVPLAQRTVGHARPAGITLRPCRCGRVAAGPEWQHALPPPAAAPLGTLPPPPPAQSKRRRCCCRASNPCAIMAFARSL